MSRYSLSAPWDREIGIQAVRRQKPQFLVFSVGPFQLGIPLLRFTEVRTLSGVTPVMRPPDYRWGQAVVYGQVVSLLDLRVELDCQAAFNNGTRVLFAWRCVNGVTESQVGLIVDSVKPVLAFDEEEFENGGVTREERVGSRAIKGDRRRTLVDLDRMIFE